jgi:hypothetical protein
MKKSIFIGIAFALCAFTKGSEIILPTTTNNAFAVGEKLKYRVTYGIMDAGEATLEVKNTTKKGEGRELIHVVGKGRSLGAFNAFFKVDDTYESYIDKKGIFPWFFVRRVNEGGYKMSQDYTFKQDKAKVDNGAGKTFVTPEGIQDMLSCFYYSRTIDYSGMKVGEIKEFKVFMDDEIWPLKIKFVGDEVIHIRKGKFNCKKFLPVVIKGRVFANENDCSFWVTNDGNRIPIFVRAKIKVGVIKMHLVDWSGIKHEINMVKK